MFCLLTKNLSPNTKIGIHNIDKVNHIKFLDLLIYGYLSWDSHIDLLVKTITLQPICIQENITMLIL